MFEAAKAYLSLQGKIEHGDSGSEHRGRAENESDYSYERRAECYNRVAFFRQANVYTFLLVWK